MLSKLFNRRQPSPMSEDQLEIPKFKLDAMSTLAKLQMEGWKTAAEVRLSDANADLLRAKKEYVETETLELYQIVKAKESVVRRMEMEYKRLARNEWKSSQQLEVLERSIANASKLMQGQHLTGDAITNAWTGLLFLINRSVTLQADVGNLLLTAEHKDIPANFDIPENQKPPSIAGKPIENKTLAATKFSLDVHVHTLLDLIHHMRRHRLVPITGSPVYRSIAEVLEKLSTAVAADMQTAQDSIAKLREGVLKDFNPGTILAIPNPAGPF